MLTLVDDPRRKKAAQLALERNLKDVLRRQGTRNIGFPGGNADHTIYSSGNRQLWAAFGGATADSAIRRYWNVFGIYQADRPAQSIAVEINIAIEGNSARVAGFFAEDRETGDVFLMHSGKIGGGRPHIGKSKFLVSSKAKLFEVSDRDGNIRNGIAVGKIDDPDLSDRVWTFVKNVQNFKDQAATGALDTPSFRRRVKEFDRYSREFSGKKRGVGGGAFEYVTYHGDIVQKLFDIRSSQLCSGEEVFNSTLIDLFVKKDGNLSEVYEVKTGAGRQVLYTAIGQLITHAVAGGAEAAKFLVIPSAETIPGDLERAIKSLGISVRRFRLVGTSRKRVVELE